MYDENHLLTVGHAKQLSNAKVDKVDGKGLSTNDYTNEEKTKLEGIEAQANKTVVDDALSTTSENPVQNKVVNTAVSTLESGKADKTEVALKADKTALTRTDNSLNALWKIHRDEYSETEKQETGMNVAPSGAMFMTMESVQGKSEQKTTNGYQLIDFYNAPFYVEGSVDIDFEATETGFVLTNNYSSVARIMCLLPLPAGTYTLSFNLSGSTNEQNVGWIGSGFVAHANNGANSLTKTTTIESTYFSIYCGAGDTISITNLIVESGSTAHAWEKFTGGIPSPNPDYPQEIHSVEEINVKVTGKNLCPPADRKLGLTGSGNNRTVIGYSYTNNNAVIVSVKPNTKYSFSKTSTSIDSFGRIGLFETEPEIDSVTTSFKSFDTASEDHLTFTTASNEHYALLFTDADVDVSLENRMFEVGEKTAYEPYTEQTRTITPPAPLNKIGDYKDVADVESGKWKLNTSVVRLLHTWGWGRILFGGNYLIRTNANELHILPDAKNDGYASASKLYGSYVGGVYGFPDNSYTIANRGFNEVNNYIYIRDDSYDDVEDFKSFLENNDVAIIVPTRTTTEQDISSSDLAFLRSLENIPADHHIFVTDQDGNDVSYLLSYLFKVDDSSTSDDVNYILGVI